MALGFLEAVERNGLDEADRPGTEDHDPGDDDECEGGDSRRVRPITVLREKKG